jgi:hypothetical protein
MNQPNKQSLIAMIEAYAASKAEVALESNRPDQDCGYSLLQKEKKCVENKVSLYNFIDKLNLDPEDAKYSKNEILSLVKEELDERLYFPTERCEPSEDSDLEYNYDTDNDPLISM